MACKHDRLFLAYAVPRNPRIDYPGALYHDMLRGNAGDPVFFDVSDRCCFSLLLQEGAVRFGFRVHAFMLFDKPNSSRPAGR